MILRLLTLSEAKSLFLLYGHTLIVIVLLGLILYSIGTPQGFALDLKSFFGAGLPFLYGALTCSLSDISSHATFELTSWLVLFLFGVGLSLPIFFAGKAREIRSVRADLFVWSALIMLALILNVLMPLRQAALACLLKNGSVDGLTFWQVLLMPTAMVLWYPLCRWFVLPLDEAIDRWFGIKRD